MSKPLQHVADGGEKLRQRDLAARIQRLSAALSLGLMEESSHFLHELVVVKENADGSLKLVQFKLFKQNISLDTVIELITYTSLLTAIPFLCKRQCFDRFNHCRSREVTANQADHLMVIQTCDHVVVRRAVEYFPNLLEESLAI